MPSARRGNSSRVFLALLSFSAFVHAQVGQILDKSKLPACAFNCALLTQAQSLCVPPTAPTAEPGIYQSCFCNSNYLAPFRAGATAGVCDAECTSATDLTQIQKWFNGLCTGGAVVVPNNAVVATGTATASTATGTASSVSSSSGSSGGHKSWIDQHYRWIIMIIVLFIAALVGILVGLYLKRKYDPKQALGGRLHPHDSMLAADEAARSLRDRHPSNIPMQGQHNMSQVYMPPLMESRESLPSRGMTASSVGMHSSDRMNGEVDRLTGMQSSDRMTGEADRSTGGGVTHQPSTESMVRSVSKLKKSQRRNNER